MLPPFSCIYIKEIGRIMKTILFSLILCFSLNIFAGTIDPDTPDHKYIEHGKKFDCVVQIIGMYNEDNTLVPFLASSVAIDKRWVLTASHVLENNEFVCVHDFKNKNSILVDKIIRHPDFREERFEIADIALCRLSSDLKLKTYPELYTNNDEVGKIGDISGYGWVGDFNTGKKFRDGNRRAGTNKIDFIISDLLICTPSIKPKTELEFLIATGDSGGGLFINNKLVGINSSIMAKGRKPLSIYNDEGGHTRVSKFVGWIRETIKKNQP